MEAAAAPVRIRAAAPGDAETLLAFIRELARYERSPGSVRATAADLRGELASARPAFEAALAEVDGRPVGFALWFHTFSTWTGRRSVYLEDLYVRPGARRRGVGRALVAHVAELALARGCPRLDWQVLGWNAPAIAFYEALGARRMGDWLPFRADGEALVRLARPRATGAAGARR